MKYLSLCVACSALFAGQALANPAWHPLFQSVLADPAEVKPVVAYDKTLTTLDGIKLFTFHYDGSADTPEEQLKLLWVRDDLKEQIDTILESMRGDTDGDIWCTVEAADVKGDVQLASETGEQAVITYQPTDAEDETARKVMEKSTATLTIDKASGQITDVLIRLNEPVKPLPVAKVTDMTVEASCAQASNGRSYFQRVMTDMRLSVMFKEDKDQRVELIENLTFPGQK